MTPRDELLAYLEKLKDATQGLDEYGLRSARKQGSISDTEYDSYVALRNAFPLLLEMAERAMECDGCQGSGLRFQLWMNPVINEPCSCMPRITRWAEQIEQVAKGITE